MPIFVYFSNKRLAYVHTLWEIPLQHFTLQNFVDSTSWTLIDTIILGFYNLVVFRCHMSKIQTMVQRQNVIVERTTMFSLIFYRWIIHEFHPAVALRVFVSVSQSLTKSAHTKPITTSHLMTNTRNRPNRRLNGM